MEWPTGKDVILLLVWGGPGMVILVGLYSLLRKPPEYVLAFVKAQQELAGSMQQMAVAVEGSTAHGTKLDQVLISQQLLLKRLEALPCVKSCPHCGAERGAHGSD